MIDLKAVIFDYGNVLCLPQPGADVERMAQLIGIPRPRFDELYWSHRDPYDRGDVDAQSYWNQIAGAGAVLLRPEQIDHLITADNESWAHPNRPLIQWAWELKDSGLKLGLLSNMHFDLRDHLAKYCDWLRVFDHLTFSCDVGCIKPDADIYHHCLGGLGVAPNDTLFLDDRHPNIEAAREFGIHTIAFSSAEQASREVSGRFRLPELKC